MKNIILSIAIVAITTAASTRSIAQSNRDVAINYRLSSALTGNESATETKVSGVHTKALRNFARTHKNQDANWFKTDKGFTATYLSEGKNAKSVYDTKGIWQYDIISYTEAYMDAGIRDLVKSRYYDYAIIGVHEFIFDGKTVYAVKMVDQRSNFLTLKVSDGQIEDITTHAKK